MLKTLIGPHVSHAEESIMWKFSTNALPLGCVSKVRPYAVPIIFARDGGRKPK